MQSKKKTIYETFLTWITSKIQRLCSMYTWKKYLQSQFAFYNSFCFTLYTLCKRPSLTNFAGKNKDLKIELKRLQILRMSKIVNVAFLISYALIKCLANHRVIELSDLNCRLKNAQDMTFVGNRNSRMLFFNAY